MYSCFVVLGTKFWKFDPMQTPPVKSTYPKPISNWDGIPDNLDAALHYTNGYTYFFKDGNYYRFNDRMFAVSIPIKYLDNKKQSIGLSDGHIAVQSFAVGRNASSNKTLTCRPFLVLSGWHGRPTVSPERRLLVVRVQGREQGQPPGTRRDGLAERAQAHVVGHTAGPQGQPEHGRGRHDNGRRWDRFVLSDGRAVVV